ncbi:MAG: PCMD domain-containing protein [Bacteroidaceae bacterium]|nr:PCMD domain-containing protein [Bacteroidaceae bacterium]
MKKIQYILSILFVAFLVVSCDQEMEIESAQGYLCLSISSLTSTHNPSRAAAPDDYNAKTLHVEILDEKGNVVKSTDNFSEDEEFQGNIVLLSGVYTIVAHSANWDGEGSGFDVPFYYGRTTIEVKPKSLVKATLTCTQANVKITVNYDQTFTSSFKSAKTTIMSSLTDVLPIEFIMNQPLLSGYIPVGDFEAKLDIVNNKDMNYSLTRTFTDVQARDHYILNFKLADEGYLGDGTGGGVHVEVDESTNTYTFTFEVPRKSAISLVTRMPNAWSNFAMLNASITAKTADFKNSGLVIQWKKVNDENWNEMPEGLLTVDALDNVTATLKGLIPNTAYEYRLCYVDGDTEVVGNSVTFTTEQQVALYNGGFESWWMDDKVAYANEQGVSYWDTSNKGAASFGGSNTTETSSPVHGGSKAAKLESKYIVIKFAAASLYTGSFGELVGTSGAKLNWGVPFTVRPTALKGYMQYAPQAVNRVGKNLPADAPAKGESDVCGMYCALLSEALQVDNTDMSTFPDWENDSRVIAYGALPAEQNVNSNGEWKEVNIPLVYRDLNRKPTHLLVVFSASKFGDYFHGGEGSILYVDDFSFEYGDTPLVK